MIFYLLLQQVTAYWGNIERMYPIRTEKSYRLDDTEITFLSDKPIRLDNEYFKTIRVGFNGYIGGTNTSKQYRIIPIFMMNYDKTANGGVVEYTEKFNKHYKAELIEDVFELFQVRLKSPEVLVVSWDGMTPVKSTKCYEKDARNSFEAVLVWEGDQTFLFVQFQQLDAPMDCTTQKYGLFEINVNHHLHASYRHQLSRTQKVGKLKLKSNRGVKGQFAFKIDDAAVFEAYEWREQRKFEEAQLL